jgi:hypothetical protein
MNEELVPLTDQRFACQGCGECCKNRWVPLTLRDILKIASVTSPEESLLIWNENRIVLERRTWDNGCVFLDNGRCTIHEIKPLICRLYPVAFSEFPILEENISYRCKNGKKVYLYLDKSCKGVGKGEKFDIEKILDLCETILRARKATTLDKVMELV